MSHSQNCGSSEVLSACKEFYKTHDPVRKLYNIFTTADEFSVKDKNVSFK